MTGDEENMKGTSGEDGPGEPSSPLRDAAVGLHEAFLSFVAAGFSESQAVALCQTLLTKDATE